MIASAAPVTEVGIEELQTWLKVVSNPKRLHILNLLMQGVQCNCELGEQLQMPRNLISHHLSILRQAGLVEVERDVLDARWVYYSVNQAALDELNRVFGAFFNPNRIQSRHPACGPQGLLEQIVQIEFDEK